MTATTQKLEIKRDELIYKGIFSDNGYSKVKDKIDALEDEILEKTYAEIFAS